MYPGYLNVGCNEIVNNERAAQYVRGLALGEDCTEQCTGTSTDIGCDRCPDLPEALGHAPYTDPATDDAPWYDPVRPVSIDFFGVSGGTVEGLSGSTATRTPIANIGDGASIGPLRRPQREISWTVTLHARSECALSYGLEWLSRSLTGDPCTGTCTGQEMFLYACCPSEIDNEDFDAEIRQLFDVGLLEGPTVTTRTWFEDDYMQATVTFTLVAGNPWIYGDSLDTGDEWVNLSLGDQIRRDPDQVFQACLPPEACAEDPMCPEPVLPPLPPVPVSPCYPRGVADFLVSRVKITSEEYPAWSQLVPVIEVNAGSQDLRRLLVRFWFNPANSECDSSQLDPCDSCGDVNVSYVPANGRLIVDGRTGRSVIECTDRFFNITRGRPNLFGAEGGLFQYPFFPCPGGLCVEIWTLDDSVPPDAEARVILVPRTDVM